MTSNQWIWFGDRSQRSICFQSCLRQLGLNTRRYPANWQRYGRAAGPVRNQQMLDEGKPDLILAFHQDIVNSKGTADMIRRANRAGVPTRILTGDTTE